MTREEMQLLLRDVVTMQHGMDSLAMRLRQALGLHGRPQASGSDQYTRPPASAAANDRKLQPDDAKLAEFRCPKCKSAMRWQWARQNGEWFAGCTEFATEKKCRGSRTFDKVMGTEAEKPLPDQPLRDPMDYHVPLNEHEVAAHDTEPPREEGDPGAGPTWTSDDIERIEKHH